MCKVKRLFENVWCFVKRNKLHLLVWSLFIASVLAAVFRYRVSYVRLWQAFEDFICAVRTYWCMLVNEEIEGASALSSLPELELKSMLPFDYNAVLHKIKAMWSVMFTKKYFLGYLSLLLNGTYVVALFGSICLPLLLIVKRVFGSILFRQNNDYYEQTKTLAFWLNHIEPKIGRVFGAVRRFFAFLCSSAYLYVFALIWLLNLNVVTILLEVVAYYLGIAATLSFSFILSFLIKLLVDVIIMFSGAPLLLWAVLGSFIVDWIRKKIGYNRLNHMERCNRGLINVLPIASLIVGTTGASKTTTVTDMGISREIMFRDKALELLQKNALKFPYFPWINVELEIKSQVEQGCIYNLATIKDWGDKLCDDFCKYPTKEMLFGYDFEQYPVMFQDDLKEHVLNDVIVTYAQLYFIYMVESALVVSNYCIRLDFQRSDCGNFPVWNHSLFEWNVEDLPKMSMTSHIIDFDMIRLGKLVVENNAWSGALEFGVVIASEFGKERKNSKELTETKKNNDETNQKNDLADYWFKMCRHGAVVDNFPFIAFISDEQRPESLGANTRDLFSIVRIRETIESNVALPFYALEGFVYEWMKPKYFDFDLKLKVNRGDRTLLDYFAKRLWQPFYAHCLRLENRFGYTVKHIQLEEGCLEGEREDHKYYLMPKKIYSDRFRTDAFAPIFRSRAEKSGRGLIQRETYANLDATPAELESQNSYAVGDMFGKMM